MKAILVCLAAGLGVACALECYSQTVSTPASAQTSDIDNTATCGTDVILCKIVTTYGTVTDGVYTSPTSTELSCAASTDADAGCTESTSASTNTCLYSSKMAKVTCNCDDEEAAAEEEGDDGAASVAASAALAAVAVVAANRLA